MTRSPHPRTATPSPATALLPAPGTVADLLRAEDVAAAVRTAEAVLFDFNGTLSLDEDLMAQLYGRISHDLLGRALTRQEYEHELVGLSDPEICLRLCELAAAPDRAGEVLSALSTTYAAAVQRQPRIPEEHCQLVHRLHSAGIPVGVVTGTLRALVEPALNRAGLARAVSTVVTIEDVRHGKPDPEGFLLGCHRLGVAPGPGVIVFEDSDAGQKAAVAAGLRCVRVAADSHGPDHSRGLLLAEVTRTLNRSAR